MYAGHRAAQRRRLSPLNRRFYERVYGYLLHRARRALSRPVAAAYLDEKLGETVRYGEFAGLDFRAGRGVANNYYAKLLGTYEKELTPIWQAIRSNSYDLVLNIGAADGLYAVGLAARYPNATAVAFEADERYRSIITHLAADNGIALDLRGFCTSALLAECLNSAFRPLALVDVEGFEYELLDLRAVPSLAGCDILLETHEFLSIPSNAEMINRFSLTHDIETIPARRRRLRDLPFDPPPGHSLRLDITALLQEHRSYPQDWLWMRSKQMLRGQARLHPDPSES